VVDAISSGIFSQDEPKLFQPIVDTLLNGGDPYMLFADFDSYLACQERASQTYLDKEKWTRKAILNVARMGAFSSDRTIQQYADEIWDAKAVPQQR